MALLRAFSTFVRTLRLLPAPSCRAEGMARGAGRSGSGRGRGRGRPSAATASGGQVTAASPAQAQALPATLGQINSSYNAKMQAEFNAIGANQILGDLQSLEPLKLAEGGRMAPRACFT